MATHRIRDKTIPPIKHLTVAFFILNYSLNFSYRAIDKTVAQL